MARGIVELARRIEARALGIIGAAILEPGLLRQRILFGLDPRDFRQADLVDLLGGIVGRRVEPELIGIIGCAIG